MVLITIRPLFVKNGTGGLSLLGHFFLKLAVMSTKFP